MSVEGRFRLRAEPASEPGELGGESLMGWGWGVTDGVTLVEEAVFVAVIEAAGVCDS